VGWKVVGIIEEFTRDGVRNEQTLNVIASASRSLAALNSLKRATASSRKETNSFTQAFGRSTAFSADIRLLAVAAEQTNPVSSPLSSSELRRRLKSLFGGAAVNQACYVDHSINCAGVLGSGNGASIAAATRRRIKRRCGKSG
jgi:hypothetical protein